MDEKNLPTAQDPNTPTDVDESTRINAFQDWLKKMSNKHNQPLFALAAIVLTGGTTSDVAKFISENKVKKSDEKQFLLWCNFNGKKSWDVARPFYDNEKKGVFINAVSIAKKIYPADVDESDSLIGIYFDIEWSVEKAKAGRKMSLPFQTGFNDITSQSADFVKSESHIQPSKEIKDEVGTIDTPAQDSDVSITGGIPLGDDYKNIEPKPDEIVNDDSTDEHTDAFYYKEAEILRAKVTDADIAVISSMTKDKRAKLKKKINQLDLRRIFPRDRQDKGFICPLCGNGSGSSGDGITPKWSESDGGYFWANCLAHGDFQGKLTDIISALNNLKGKENWYKILAIGQKILDYAESSSSPTFNFEKYSTQKEMSPEEIALIKSDIVDAQTHLPELPESEKRGLTDETLQHFNFGFFAQWILPSYRLDGSYMKPTPRIIIPTSDSSYNAILIKSARNDTNKKWKALNAGSKQIFNVDAIVAGCTVLIVEGELDAASVWQATQGNVNVIAIGGKNPNKLIQYLNEKFPVKDTRLDFSFVVLLDNDEGGVGKDKEQSQKFVDELIQEGYPATFDFISYAENKVDANDLLIDEGDAALKARVDEIIGNAQPKLCEVCEQLAKDIDFTNRINDWKDCDGEIDSAVIAELKKGIAYLESLNAKDLTVEIVRNPKTLKYLAACYEYNFSDVAEEFIGKAIMANLPNVTRKIINAEISRIRTKLRKEQKNFSKAQQEKVDEEKARQAQIAYQLLKDEKRKRYLELMKLPPSNERDEEIFSILRDVCDWKRDKHAQSRKYIEGTDKNLHIIFECDPNLKGLIGYNEFADNFFLLKNPKWAGSFANNEWTDADDANLRIYLRRHYGEFSNNKLVDDYIISYGHQNAFHPVKQYLESLKWDGTKRAEEFFIKFLGVDDTPYSRIITKNWLLGAVCRIYYPGCNFQNALVLRGAQEIGKGTCLSKLGRQWHVALSSSTDDPHAIDDIQVGWIVELEEFSAGRKSEINALKSFISRKSDTRRAAYERRSKQTPRHCVFSVTVNDETFLRDQTGNRRYRILECKNTKEDFQRLVDELSDEYIGQVWAEVMTIFNAEFSSNFDEKKLELPSEIKTQADKVAEIYTFNDGMADEISAYLERKILPEFIWNVLTKEERRKFFTDASIPLDIAEINRRWRLNFPKDAQTQINRLNNFVTYNSESVLKINLNDNKVIYHFYGSVYRMHVCAAEIFCECFGQDTRKNNVHQIYAALAKMDDWEKGTSRLQGKDTAYKDQKNFYVRKNNPNPSQCEMEKFLNELDGC